MNYQKPKAVGRQGKATKVRKKRVFIWELLQSEILLRDGHNSSSSENYILLHLHLKKSRSHKRFCVVCVRGENSPELFLQEMTATVKLCTQPFWGYEIWLAWACFIMLHWIFYLIDSRALVKNVHSYLFLPSNREVYRGVNCPFTH